MTYTGAVESLPFALKHFQQDWDNPKTEDIFVVRPFEYFVKIGGKTFRREAPDLDALAIEGLGVNIAHLRGQYVDEDFPLFDGEMPTGERVNLVLPPCVPNGMPALSIRRGSEEFPQLEDLDEAGLWDLIRDGQTAHFVDNALRAEARKILDDKEISSLLRFAIKHRWSVAFVGETGSGKTFDGKAVINAIPTTYDERILFCSDANEMQAAPHPNVVHLLAQKGGDIGMERLIESALRMGPRWIIVPEIRDGAAFAFLRALFVSPGITSWHARSAENAFESVETMIRQHPAGANLPRDALRTMLRTFIDLVIHVVRLPGGKFRATNIMFGSDI